MFNFNDLVRRYNESHRVYHNIEHIQTMLMDAHGLSAQGTIGRAEHLAIWYHDAIYIPNASDNEQRSADLFKEQCVGRLHAAAVTEVYDAILMTANHHLDQKPINWQNYFLDADLAGLGKSLEVYLLNLLKIRLEYAHVETKVFREKRLAWLESMLSRNSRFYSVSGKYQYEKSSVENLRFELDADAPVFCTAMMPIYLRYTCSKAESEDNISHLFFGD